MIYRLKSIKKTTSVINKLEVPNSMTIRVFCVRSKSFKNRSKSVKCRSKPVNHRPKSVKNKLKYLNIDRNWLKMISKLVKHRCLPVKLLKVYNGKNLFLSIMLHSIVVINCGGGVSTIVAAMSNYPQVYFFLYIYLSKSSIH